MMRTHTHRYRTTQGAQGSVTAVPADQAGGGGGRKGKWLRRAQAAMNTAERVASAAYVKAASAYDDVQVGGGT